MGRKKQSVVKKSAKVFLSSVRKMNNSSIDIMKSEMRPEHSKYVDVEGHQVGFSDREINRCIEDYKEDLLKNPSRLYEIVEAMLHMYLFEISSSRNFSYKLADMSPLAREIKNRGYSFTSVSRQELEVGFYSPRNETIWMSQFCPIIKNEYESRLRTKLENHLASGDFEEDFLQALEDFCSYFEENRGIIKENNKYRSTLIHEYQHKIFDRLTDHHPHQTVNEAFSWFISYMLVMKLSDENWSWSQRKFKAGKPGGEYKESELIYNYAGLVGKKYLKEANGAPVISWTVDLQKAVAKSDLSDKKAFKLNILPENLQSDIENFYSIMEELGNHHSRFLEIEEHYRNMFKLGEDIRADLIGFNPQELENKDLNILESADNWANARSIFKKLLMEEASEANQVVEDLEELEKRLVNIAGISKDKINKTQQDVENALPRNPSYSLSNNKDAFLWDILLYRAKIRQAQEKVELMASDFETR